MHKVEREGKEAAMSNANETTPAGSHTEPSPEEIAADRLADKGLAVLAQRDALPWNKLILKWNNTDSRTTCSVCGGPCPTPVGPVLVFEGSWDWVCPDCAKIHDEYMYRAYQLCAGRCC